MDKPHSLKNSMAAVQDSRRIPRFLLPVCVGMLSCMLVLLATSRYGAGLSSDSVGYISAARSLVADGTLTTYLGIPMVNWPPLYPALLAAVYWLSGVDPLLAAAWVNALLFGVIAGLSSWLFIRSKAVGRSLALLGSIALVLAEPLLSVSRMAWSEPLFILWVMIFMLCAQRWRHSAERSSLIGMGIAAACAALTRYIGITLAVTGVLLVLLDDRQRWCVRLRQGGLFGAVTSVPLALWLGRNWIVAGSLMGERAPSSDTFWHNVELAFTTLISWLSPYKFLPELSLALVFGALAAGLTALALIFIRHIHAHTLPAICQHLIKQFLWHEAWPAWLFVLVYGSLLIISASVTAIDAIDSRLLSPLFVPLLWLILVATNYFVQGWQEHTWLRRMPLVLFAMVFVFYGGTVSGYRLFKCIAEGAGGYATNSWQESETAAYLRTCAFDGPIYSNASDAAYILSGRSPMSSPEETAGRSKLVLNTLDELISTWPESSPALLVWFNNAGRNYLYSPAELQAVADLEPVVSLNDGTIYLVER